MAKLLIYNKGSSNVHKLDCGANSSTPTIGYENGASHSLDDDHELHCQNKRAKGDILITYGNSTKKLNCSNKRFTTNIITSYHNPFNPSMTNDQKIAAIAQYVDMYYAGKISDLYDYFTPGDSVDFYMPSFAFTYGTHYNGNTDDIEETVLYTPAKTVTARIIGINHDVLTSDLSMRAALTFQINAFFDANASSSSCQLDGNGNRSTWGNGLYFFGASNDSAWGNMQTNPTFMLCTPRHTLHYSGSSGYFYNSIPSAFYSRLKQVRKSSQGVRTNNTRFESVSDDYVFVPSVTEIVGSNGNISVADGYQYELFSNPNYNGTCYGYTTWTRDMAGTVTGLHINGDKSVSQAPSWGTYANGLSYTFCFCL